jgi:hypothetical protein
MADDEIPPQEIIEAATEPYLPVPYVTNFTNQTLTITPLLLTAIRVWIVAMLEWGSLRFIDQAPASVWIASSVIAAVAWVILENRDWLNFKNRKYFPVSMTVLFLIWAGITAYGYYSEGAPNAVASNLQSQLTEVTKQRDAVRQERDAALRSLQSGAGTSMQPPARQPSGQVAPPADDPNLYPPLIRERQRALVDELVAAKDILGPVPLIAAGAQNEARAYRNALMPLFDRAQIVTPTGDDATHAPDQTGVMVALQDLNNPSPAARKILEILTSTGFRPKVISANPNLKQWDFYIFIGPQPL